jgi:hypothetical protein
MKMPWHTPRLEHEVVEFFDLKVTPKQFRLHGGRYGMLIDGDFKPGATATLQRAGLVHDRAIPVSRTFSGPAYQVLELTLGSYELTVVGSAIVSAQIASIKG